ncbi:MAG: RpiB/LacA/LacB family sugar-phosphate isomerase [Bacilli bacterium]|nr:RpiB/LacA/LacB family sugar-phosphate isomerase [Bacilli bacterium]
MKIGLASDHRGYKLKEYLKQILPTNNYEIVDFGTDSEVSTDYPDYAFALGEAVVSKQVDFGVAICGSGIGISIACNKVKGIRCAKVSNKEEAQITRIDNNSNIVAFSEKVSESDALDIVKTFITTEASPEEKHIRRVNKIIAYEENN